MTRADALKILDEAMETLDDEYISVWEMQDARSNLLLVFNAINDNQTWEDE